MNKNSNKSNKWHKNMTTILWVLNSLMNMFQSSNLGPLVHKHQIVQLGFCVFLENRPTCTKRISLIFNHMKVFSYFLESSKSPLQYSFGFIFIEVSMFKL